MFKLAAKLPAKYTTAPSAAPGAVTSDADTGGYDVMIGGYGFRLATDQQMQYERGTEPTTTRRFDSSLEPGEQSLSPLPWIKSQSSFHAGAGQVNLEQGFTAFQYQAEQVEHIRYENSLGVNVWTPGTVTRLPDVRLFSLGFTASCMVTATVGGVDYAVIGGQGNLSLAAWLSGPDASPTVTAIDLSGTTYGGASNCNITSLATDGANYYGIIQLATIGFNATVVTYIISGKIGSTAAPLAIYEVPNTLGGTVRHNVAHNPSFETDASGFVAFGTPLPTIARSTAQAFLGAASLAITSTGASTSQEGALTTIATNVGTTYTVSTYLRNPSANGTATGPALYLNGTATISSRVTVRDTWTRVSITFVATDTGMAVGIDGGFTANAQVVYVDAMLAEASAIMDTYFDGSVPAAGYTVAWDGTANTSTSTATSISQVPSVIAWQKARLIGLCGNSMYELTATATPHSPLPAARYTHPLPTWTWTCGAEAPTGIYAAGYVGGESSILGFTLDTSGGTPFLTGGETIAKFPLGEQVYSMVEVVGSFLAVGTSQGARLGTFDTYTGALKLSPLSVTTTSPVLSVATRDRFVYATYTNQQANGKTGLVGIDVSMIVDAAGRNAYAPDLRPPTTAPTGLGAVSGVAVLPGSGRILFVTPEGLHVEGNGPGSDGDAWLRTSRIRYDTAELKLFKLGRIHGAFDVASIQVTGIAPFVPNVNLGTFGFITNVDPGEFRLPSGLNEWIQLQFDLQGSACALNSYQVKAIPSPARQHIISFTVNCFSKEIDRFGLDVTDPQTPRQRFRNLQDLEKIGNEIRFTEFTNQGPVAELVVIDQLVYRSPNRPNIDDDFGGYITIQLRTTET